MSLCLKSCLILAIVIVPIQLATGQEKELKIGLIGDSTVATTYGWGPALERLLDDRVQVLHFAKNGSTLASLSKRLDELLALRPDYVLIQFGHNDQKKYPPEVYRDKLTSYVERVAKSGSKPIVLSSVTRRHFDEQGKIEMREAGLKANLAEYAKVAEEVAKEQGAGFIDLHSLSVEHHNRIGPEASAAYNFDDNDKTHFSPKGAEAIAKLIFARLNALAPPTVRYSRR